MGNKGGFSWKRLTGVTRAKQRLSRKSGVPMTKSGRQRKVGKAVGGCAILLVLFSILFLSGMAVAFAFAQSQQKPGYVYVISNVGSFGEGVYKVGMTQRDDPQTRVNELGDASVPFPFDVHVMIATDDPRGLERKIMADLDKYRVNKVNPRKEFYRTDLITIIATIKKHHSSQFDVIDAASALDYRQSRSIEMQPITSTEYQLNK
jgi:hypothetical protein